MDPINKIRERASNSTGDLIMVDGSPIMDYHVELYVRAWCVWIKISLGKALNGKTGSKWQAKGVGSLTYNDGAPRTSDEPLFSLNGTILLDIAARFTAGRDEFSHSASQMNWAKGNYTQNPVLITIDI